MATQTKELMNWNSLKSQFEKQLKDESEVISKAILDLMKKVHEKYSDHQILLVGNHHNHSWRPVIKEECGIYHNICPHCLGKYFNPETKIDLMHESYEESTESFEMIQLYLEYNQSYYCLHCEKYLYDLNQLVQIDHSGIEGFDNNWYNGPEINCLENISEQFDFIIEFDEQPEHLVFHPEQAPKSLEELDQCMSPVVYYNIMLSGEYYGLTAYGSSKLNPLTTEVHEWLVDIGS